VRAIFWKEMADHFGRRRFTLLLGLVALGAVWAAFIDINEMIRTGTGFLYLDVFTTTSGVPISLLQFISFFGPIIGITLGFDAINSERTQGTLSRVLAQPVYRDAVFNGKFLAGLTTLALVLASMGISAVGVSMFRIGIAPQGEEIVRLTGFGLVTVAYLAFWLALAMTASIFLRNAVASALVSIGVWIAASKMKKLAASAIAERVVPETETDDQIRERFNVERWIARASPGELFSEATGILMDPVRGRTLTPLALAQDRLQGLLSAPVSAGQSLQLVWPHIVVLVAMVAVLLALSYVRFMREEIRA
jgi:ABC-2 type transport system permease protein